MTPVLRGELFLFLSSHDYFSIVFHCGAYWSIIASAFRHHSAADDLRSVLESALVSLTADDSIPCQ